MSREGDHLSDNHGEAHLEETHLNPKITMVDPTDPEELRRHYEGRLAEMQREVATAQRAKATAEATATRLLRNPPTATPPARRQGKGKEVLYSISNSRAVVGNVDREDFCDSDEQREYEAFVAREAAKEARRKKKAHDARYGVGTSAKGLGLRYTSSPSGFNVDTFRAHQSPLTPHSDESTDADDGSDAEEFADDREREEGNTRAHFSNLPPIRDSPEMQVHSRDYIPPPKNRRLREKHDTFLARNARAVTRARDQRRRHSPPPPIFADYSEHSEADEYQPRRRAPEPHRRPRERRDEEDRRPDPRATSRRDVKVKFEYFEGTYDPLVFLEWMQTTEHTL